MNLLFKTITFNISFIIYIIIGIKLFLNDNLVQNIDYILPIFYGLSFSLLICGLIINNVYYHKFVTVYGATRNNLIISDIVGHIIPFLLVYNYVPDNSELSPMIPVVISAIYIIFLSDYFIKIYIGVPSWLIRYAGPFLFLLSYFYKFYF
jgi:hypothetical protein